MQSQIVCSGCRTILIYPRNGGGASNVCCALCNAFTSVPPSGMEMDRLICVGCRTLLMYTRGATSVRCSCCLTVNRALDASQIAQVRCGNCRTMLMYPSGAPSVKCAVCHYVTNVNMNNGIVPVPIPVPVRPNGAATSEPMSPVSTLTSQSDYLTIIVENPKSVDESGKLVSNMAVGVTTEKKAIK